MKISKIIKNNQLENNVTIFDFYNQKINELKVCESDNSFVLIACQNDTIYIRNIYDMKKNLLIIKNEFGKLLESSRLMNSQLNKLVSCSFSYVGCVILYSIVEEIHFL